MASPSGNGWRDSKKKVEAEQNQSKLVRQLQSPFVAQCDPVRLIA